MTLNEKLGQSDFWNIKRQEELARNHFAEQKEAIGRAISLGKRMSSLKSAAGFKEFVEAVKDVTGYAEGLLLGSKDPYETARFQGRVTALKDILSLMTDNERRLSELDKQLQVVQDQASAIFRPDGKVDTGVDLDGKR